MNRDRRYVFDTNVLVSAAAFPLSTPYRAFEAALRAGRLVFSTATEDELLDVLVRPRLQRYLNYATKREFLNRMADAVLHIEVAERVVACRDPKDDKFLELALVGEARCIVTGDADLLVLHPFRGIPILTPEQFLASAHARA